MRLKQYIEDTKILQQFQVHSYFSRFSNEAFDYKADIKISLQDNEDFICSFIIDKNKYKYHAKIQENVAIIIFYPIGPEDLFKEVESGKYSGKVFAMIMNCTELLLDKYSHLQKIGFTTEHKKLESLYDKMNKYILKRFKNGHFEEKVVNHKGNTQYTYGKEK